MPKSTGMKTPLPYHGGKQRLASWIVSKMPKHTVYVEPFFGGGAVFFRKPLPAITNNHYREVINDKENRVVSFWCACRDDMDRLAHDIKWTPYAREEYERAVDVCRGAAEGDMALAVWIAYAQSFGHTGFATKSWGFSKCGCNHAATFERANARLEAVRERMAGVYIENGDALDVIRRWDSPQTLFYCDPPYPGTDMRAYKGYTIEDYQALVDTLDGCQGAFLLSCFDNKVRIPEDWVVYSKESSGSHNSRDNYKVGNAKSQGARKKEMLYYRPRKGTLKPTLEAVLEKPCFDVFKG